MNIARLFTLSLLALALPLLAVTADDIPLAKAVECSPRAGLPNFFAKLQAGKEVHIGYLGGSITAQAGWRPDPFLVRVPAAHVFLPLHVDRHDGLAGKPRARRLDAGRVARVPGRERARRTAPANSALHP